MSSELQTILVLCIIAAFTFMELATRRYQATVTATADDTKLELLMFLSLVAVCQPLALLSTNALGEWAAPGYRDALHHLQQAAVAAVRRLRPGIAAPGAEGTLHVPQQHPDQR